MSDPDIAAQFSGPYAQTLMQAVDQIIAERAPELIYLKQLSIATADSPELDTIGGIVGYPWPNAPTGIFDANIFEFTTGSGVVINPLIGFGGVGQDIGGIFTSATPAIGNLIPIAFYRLLLTQVAFLKSHGLTFQAIDQICFVFGSDYLIDTVSANEFLLGANATFPTIDPVHGLSGVNPPYNTEGGQLGGVNLIDSDIIVTFITQIGAGNLFLIQSIFDRFTTSPRVFVSQGS